MTSLRGMLTAILFWVTPAPSTGQADTLTVEVYGLDGFPTVRRPLIDRRPGAPGGGTPPPINENSINRPQQTLASRHVRGDHPSPRPPYRSVPDHDNVPLNP